MQRWDPVLGVACVRKDIDHVYIGQVRWAGLSAGLIEKLLTGQKSWHAAEDPGFTKSAEMA